MCYEAGAVRLREGVKAFVWSGCIEEKHRQVLSASHTHTHTRNDNVSTGTSGEKEAKDRVLQSGQSIRTSS